MKQHEDLRYLIDLNDKFFLTRELFDSDSSKFENVIKKLNDFNSYESAENAVLNQMAAEMGWDIEGKPVQVLLKIVNRQFA